MPESEYRVRELVELPHAPGVTEIMFPDVNEPAYLFGVVSSQGDDHVAGVHIVCGGKHRLVCLDADDALASARRLLQLAAAPDDDKRARAALRRMIDVSTSPEQIVDRLLEHFEVFPRAAE